MSELFAGFDPQVLWAALRAFVITLIATPVCRDVFYSYSIVDAPDRGRKLHGRPIPRVGGIAIALGYVLSLMIGGGLGGAEAELSLLTGLFPAAALVFGIGLIDDFIGLKPWHKLGGQLVAAGLAYWAGVRVVGVAGYSIGDVTSAVITVLWLLLCTNAFNLVDGLDGLAAGIGFFCTLTMFGAAVYSGHYALALATLPLAGALLGFLCFNFNPATIFLGDGGSLLIGFLLGCFAAVWSHKSVTLLGMTAPLIALSIPLLDVLLCIGRRFLRDQPIFGADRGHIHHRLLDRGLTPRRAVFVIYGVSGICAAVSLLQSFVPNVYMALGLLVLFGALMWFAIRFLGYAEFVLAGRILRTGGFQRLVNAQIDLEEFRRDVRRSGGEVWPVLCAWYQRLGFDSATLEIAGAPAYRIGLAPDDSCWTVRIPVGRTSITFAKKFGTAAPIVVSSVVEVLRTELAGSPPASAAPAPRARVAAEPSPEATSG
jgi:UDP-GlcNAc:undecaprenyl-phosphate GlcNAc-1-phosphate transferase